MRMITDWLDANKLWLLLGAGSTFGYFWLAEWKQKLNITGRSALCLSILNSLFGVLFVKIFAFLEGEPGGMSLFGGVFFLPIVYFLGAKITKRNFAYICDIFAICTIFTVMCARTNCLLSGCCGGVPIPGTDGLKWPTQMMEIVFYIGLIVFLGRKVGKPQYRGRVYPMYLMIYGIFRFLLEFIREKEVQSLFHLSHLWAVMAFLIGWFLFKRLDNLKMTGKHAVKDKMQSKA